MKATQPNNYKESQCELAAGVLKQAEQDLQRFHAAASAIERELYLDAYRWLMSDDSTWPFSFLRVCESLELVPEDVRRDLIRQLSRDRFGRWVHRYGRTIRKLGKLFAGVVPLRQTMKPAAPVSTSQ